MCCARALQYMYVDVGTGAKAFVAGRTVAAWVSTAPHQMWVTGEGFDGAVGSRELCTAGEKDELRCAFMHARRRRRLV